jgi:hypothetical protein
MHYVRGLAQAHRYADIAPFAILAHFLVLAMSGPSWWTSGAHGKLSPWAKAQVLFAHLANKGP